MAESIYPQPVGFLQNCENHMYGCIYGGVDLPVAIRRSMMYMEIIFTLVILVVGELTMLATTNNVFALLVLINIVIIDSILFGRTQLKITRYGIYIMLLFFKPITEYVDPDSSLAARRYWLRLFTGFQYVDFWMVLLLP